MIFTRSKSIAVVCALVTTGLFASTSSTSSASTNSEALSSTINSIPGVSVDTNGTFHYSNNLTSPEDMSSVTTSIVQGIKNVNGVCVFSESNSAGSQFGTEISYNPSTCQDTMISGQLTSKGSADLAAITPAMTASPNRSKFAFRPARPFAPQQSATISTASYNGYWAAYNKLAYIDPFNLTIVSLSNNFTWQISGTSVPWGITNPSAFMEHFGGDVTTNLGGGTSYLSFNGGTARQSLIWNSWTNTSFENWVVFFMGVAGYAACGFNSSPANFYLQPNVLGYNNATFSTSDTHTKSGGCTDLVHTNYNSGGGSLN